ncbi:MAG: peptidyl-prolyl cis-trans isomerase, partial [Bryobacter sp.]|nr:peptidyl-prolyl cis-trans isomerase [Bryobacter sp.]
PKAFVEQFGLLLHLQGLAEQEKMHEQEPHKWRLLYNRALYLAQARLNAQNGRRAIPLDEQKKYYDEHKGDFARARVRAVYLGFNEKRGDAETEKLAADIANQARKGADFATLARTYSEDPESKKKDGEFPVIKPGDSSFPPAIKTAIFQLKPGQVSDPIRQPSGHWVFKLDDFVIPPYDEVKEDILLRVMDRDFQVWMEGVRKSIKVELKDPSFFERKQDAPAQAQPAKP